MSTAHHLQIHPSISNGPAYLEMLGMERALKSTGALFEAYRQLSRTVTSDIERVIAARGQFFVPIPPIALEILKRVSKPGDILDEAFLVRRRFSTVREAYAESAHKISNDNVPIRKSLAALEKLSQILAELGAPYGSGERRRILEWSTLADSITELHELAAGNYSSLVKVFLGKPLDWIRYWLSRRKFLQLFRLRSGALRTTNYQGQIRRIWGKAVDFAGEPPLRLHDNIDYPRGWDWRVTERDFLGL